MRVKINNVGPYKIDEGFTIEENYNETLDSASIRISHLENKIDIEPFDLVEIIELNRYFCVDSFNCVEEAMNQSDTTYSYSINLFSLTKKMENYALPNLSVTPRKIGTKKTIHHYIDDLRTFYISDYEDWGYTDKFILKFTNIDCPEMQWSNPTFREVCNDLTMTADCVVTLVYDDTQNKYLIDYIDLTQTTDGSSKTYNYKTESKSSSDYLSEIRMDLQNVMQTNVEGVNNVVTTSEYLTFTSNDAVITSENCYLKTQYPILNIKHLWLTIVCAKGDTTSPTDLTATIIKQDLCNIRAEYNGETNYSNLVYEQKEYDTKEALYRDNIHGVNAISNNDGYNIEGYYSKYKNFCLHFTRNSNIITGFEQKTTPIFFQETPLLFYLKKICALNNLALGEIESDYGQLVVDGINAGNGSYFNTYFQIEYETTYNMVFSASKQEKQRHKRTIIDNQTNAWVDAYSQGFLEYQKANRLGNLQVMYNQRGNSDNNSGLFVIGDKKEDNIIYRTEYQYYKNHIDVNAYATKDYVLCNYFTGIKSKVRTWVNAKDEAFIRHDLIKYYCVFDYKENYETDFILDNYFTYDLLRMPTRFMTSHYLKPIKYALIRTEKNPNIYPSNQGKFLLNCISRLVGNSIVFTVGFEDNWIVDKHPNVGTRPSGTDYNDTGIIEYDNISPITLDTTNDYFVPPSFTPNAIGDPIGGITTNYFRYCDDNGEFDKIYIDFYNEINYYYEDNIANNYRTFILGLYVLPVLPDNISGNEYQISLELHLHKDNKEKPVISTQLEFATEDDSIKYTRRFLEREQIIRSDSDSEFLKTRTYDENMVLISEVTGTTDFSFNTVNAYCAYLRYTGDTTNVKYVEICEDDGTSILLYDITKNENHSLYLNMRRTR